MVDAQYLLNLDQIKRRRLDGVSQIYFKIQDLSIKPSILSYQVGENAHYCLPDLLMVCLLWQNFSPGHPYDQRGWNGIPLLSTELRM